MVGSVFFRNIVSHPIRWSYTEILYNINLSCLGFTYRSPTRTIGVATSLVISLACILMSNFLFGTTEQLIDKHACWI